MAPVVIFAHSSFHNILWRQPVEAGESSSCATAVFFRAVDHENRRLLDLLASARHIRGSLNMKAPMATAIDHAAPPVEAARTAPAFGERRFGQVNWLGLETLIAKEIRRFMKVSMQTIFAPVITTLLFLVVFIQAFRRGGTEINGIPYVEFLAPGLIMMAILTNAFANSSSSLIIGKVQGSIVDVLMPPLSASELTVAFLVGAAARVLATGYRLPAGDVRLAIDRDPVALL
mgnify:CR=1 FL=1